MSDIPPWRPSSRGESHTVRIADAFDLVVAPSTEAHFGREITTGYDWRVENAMDHGVFAGLTACTGTADTLDDAKGQAVEALRSVLGGALRELPLIDNAAPVSVRKPSRRRAAVSGPAGNVTAVATTRVPGDAATYGGWD